MPSKNMLPKGKRRVTVKPQYRAHRDALAEEPIAVPVLDDLDDEGDGVRRFDADRAAHGMRLDAYLAKALPDISRARVQLLIEHSQVRVDGVIAKPKHKLHGGEHIAIAGEPRPEPLHATPEDIPLTIVFEDPDLAVIDKPAGMMVHAGAGASDDARSRGTLVNALLHHLNTLSTVGGELRPGIVHRLDKQTSGLILVAKNDSAHRKLGAMFSERQVHKTYLALVHGWLAQDVGTVSAPIARDLLRRTRMTTRRADGRSAISHWQVLDPANDRIEGPYGRFTLVQVTIETGRTHQIRVHMQSIGHPVVGDTLYGAPRSIPAVAAATPPRAAGTPAKLTDAAAQPISLDRNFLHAARLAFTHPRTSKQLELSAPLPQELEAFLGLVRPPSVGKKPAKKPQRS